MYLLGSCGFCNVLEFLFNFYYIPSSSRSLCWNWHICSNVFGNSGSIWDTLCLVSGSCSSLQLITTRPLLLLLVLLLLLRLQLLGLLLLQNNISNLCLQACSGKELANCISNWEHAIRQSQIMLYMPGDAVILTLVMKI